MMTLRFQLALLWMATRGAVGIWFLAVILRPASDIGREITASLLR